MSGKYIDIVANDGHQLQAYLSENESSQGLVIIIQEVFGLTDNILQMVDLYNKAGYTAVAPAFFDRIERSCVFDYSAIKEAKAMTEQLDTQKVLTDIQACIDHLQAGQKGEQKVATIGYCWGGSMAFFAACDLEIDAAIGYYGRHIAHNLDKRPKAPIMLHFGALDGMIPISDVEAIKVAFPKELVYIYENAGHGFSCLQRESYHKESDELAYQRSIDFLETHLKA